MKIASYRAAGGTGYGVVMGEGIVDAGKLVPHRSLRELLAAGALDQLRAAVRGKSPDHKLSDVELLTPVPDAEKIVCIGINYKGHILEVGRKFPEQPSVFLRLHSSLAPHGKPIVMPKVSGHFDYEGELAVVIGKPGRHIAARDALGHVAGYTCFNDGSIRDFQTKGSLAMGKNFTESGSCGPWMVTADEIPDPSKLHLATRVNGKQVQTTGVDDLIFDIPAIIAYVSQAIPLVPGDVIATGTPEGVALGQADPVWLKVGDTVEVEISGIGVLRNRVGGEQA